MYVATQTRGTPLGNRNVKRIPKMINILKCLPLICQEIQRFYFTKILPVLLDTKRYFNTK